MACVTPAYIPPPAGMLVHMQALYGMLLDLYNLVSLVAFSYDRSQELLPTSTQKKRLAQDNDNSHPMVDRAEKGSSTQTTGPLRV